MVEAPFVGVDNYQQVLADERFWAAVGRTLGLTASGIVIEALLGLGLAILMADVVRGRRSPSAIYLLPMMVIRWSPASSSSCSSRSRVQLTPGSCRPSSATR